MADFSEFQREWRPLAGAFIGMGSALSLNSYILSIFAPYLMKDLGWTMSQWASLGTVQMLIMFSTPVAGRLADVFGVRRVAAVGALSFPLCLLAIASMSGSIRTYLAIYIVQVVIGGMIVIVGATNWAMPPAPNESSSSPSAKRGSSAWVRGTISSSWRSCSRPATRATPSLGIRNPVAASACSSASSPSSPKQP